MTDQPGRVRWGVLGPAAIAVHKVIPAMQRSQRCEVVAIASREAGRAAATAEQMGISVTTAPTTISWPIPMWRRCTSRCPITSMRSGRFAPRPAGKHVLCEKPLALSAAQAARWSRAAERPASC